MEKTGIIKSSLYFKKEQELKSLKKELKQLRTKLQKNKDKLSLLKDSIQDIFHKVNTGIIDKMKLINDLSKKIKDLSEQIISNRKIKKRYKEEVIAIVESIGMIEPLEDEMDTIIKEREIIREKLDPDEEQEFSSFNELLNSFSVAPDEEEQRKIRKLYIRLATRLHPDKAVNEKEAEYFHGIMQRINLAYEKHDFDELLKIESQYKNHQSSVSQDNNDTENAIIENLQKEIDILIKQVELVKSQNQRIKEEIGDLQNHDIGKTFQHFKNSKKTTGVSIDDQIDSIEKMRQLEILVISEFETLLKTGKCNFDRLADKLNEIIPTGFEPEYEIDDEDVLEIFLEMLQQGEPKQQKKRNGKKGVEANEFEKLMSELLFMDIPDFSSKGGKKGKGW